MIEEYSCIHVAAHALQDRKDPLDSAISVHDGHIELSTIIQKNIQHADFAYLSACETGSGDESLPDEVVHLVAGMLIAGYRGCVGTMWSIEDSSGPDIAEEFYEKILELGHGKLDGVHAAEALHHSIQTYRTRPGENASQNFMAWVPYVHYGL